MVWDVDVCMCACRYYAEAHTVLANLLQLTTGSSSICAPIDKVHRSRMVHSPGLPGSQQCSVPGPVQKQGGIPVGA